MTKKTFDKIAEGLNEALDVARDDKRLFPHERQWDSNPPRTKSERIARLRSRLDNARTEKDLRDVIKGLLDLLGDEL